MNRALTLNSTKLTSLVASHIFFWQVLSPFQAQTVCLFGFSASAVLICTSCHTAFLLIRGWTYTPNVAQRTKRKLQTVVSWLNDQQIWMVCLNVIDKVLSNYLPNLDCLFQTRARLVVCLFGRKSVWVCWQGKSEQSSKPSNEGQAAPESQMN